MTDVVPALFKPVGVGAMTLQHRVVLAPLTRNRANSRHVHTDMAVLYYAQRATEPGTLLISESITIVPEATGRPNVPGIWSEEQIASWKRITDAVHAKGSYIFAQLRAYGRGADPTVLEKEGPFPLISASDVPLTDNSTPRPLTVPEIRQWVAWYSQAAERAIRAGFDGVELHGANGYLIDQFNSDRSNKRTDEYGGSVENRSRFLLEVVDAVCEAVGEQKTAIRLSPWSDFQEMLMEDPVPTYTYIVRRLAERHPSLAFLDLVEPGVKGAGDGDAIGGQSNDFVRAIWAPRPIVSAGGYTRESAIQTAETKGDLIAFGRPFIGNPDLPRRLRKNIPLTVADRSTYYAYEDPHGYIDFPFADESPENGPLN